MTDVKQPKILVVGAMDSELQPLIKAVGKSSLKKVLNTFPLYLAKYKSLDFFILKTFVGDVNASVAGFAAIREINPDYVIKFGAVGGSFPESKAGDIIVPQGFFHRTSWITRNKITNKPCCNASEWESVFGEMPFQVNSNNLGGLPYYFSIPKLIQNTCEKSLNKLGMKFVTAYVGGGNMWMFDKEVLNNVAKTMLPKDSNHQRFVSDMESYSLAHACYLQKNHLLDVMLLLAMIILMKNTTRQLYLIK